MRLVALITAHRAPHQLGRLVRRLESSWPDIRIVIHIDGRVDESPFRRTCRGTSAVFIQRRVDVYWAHDSQLEAQLRLVEEALTEPFDWAVLLSGQCYPVRPLADLAEHLGKDSGPGCIDIRHIETEWPEQSVRFSSYHMARLKVRAPKTHEFVRRVIKRLPLRRRPPDGVEFFGGSAWWCLRRETIETIDSSRRNERKLRRSFRWTLCADEGYIHTVLGVAGLADRVSPRVTYDRFEPGVFNPVVWTSEGFDELVNSGCYFARKFDQSIDPKILDLIDSAIDGSG